MSDEQPKEQSQPAAPEKKKFSWAITLPWIKALGGVVGFLMIIVAIVTTYFGIIDWRIRVKLNDPEFKTEIARRVRPAMVFDANGRVLADLGVLALLEGVPGIKTTTWTNESGGTSKKTMVTVRPKGLLAVEPILEILDESGVSVTTRRIEGTAWEILVTARYSFIVDGEEVPTNLATPRYRLEIVPP